LKDNSNSKPTSSNQTISKIKIRETEQVSDIESNQEEKKKKNESNIKEEKKDKNESNIKELRIIRHRTKFRT